MSRIPNIRAVSNIREISPQSAVFAFSLLAPLLISILHQTWRLPEFAPPQIVYSNNLLPLLLAPWASPIHPSRFLSRLIQASLLFRIPGTSVLPCYLSWIVIGLGRTLSGFLLSRSVGWAYPRLFNHWALYETSSGIGPALVTNLLTSGARPCLESFLIQFKWYRSERAECLPIVCLCAALSWLDNAPWTYTMGIVLAVALNVWRAVHTTSLRESSYHPLGLDAQGPPRRLRMDLQTALLTLVALPIPSLLSPIFASHASLRMPSSPAGTSPLLEILILSYPRPNENSSSDTALSQTITSYLPYVDANTALSVFTHALPHDSFQHAKTDFSNSPVQFYTDEDTHPDAYSGQYLHVAEAFRWASEKGTRRAEWVMLVEDDFPLCGDWGWQGILGVMNELEAGRISTTHVKKWGGFVATGGSGLVIHRSLLPILTHTLRAYAMIHSPLPPSLPHRPADIIIQDCLLGRDPLCPSGADGVSLVITSRLVMDHVGGNLSTAKGRVYDANKWRCGWRHPFHGRPEVQVVPV